MFIKASANCQGFYCLHLALQKLLSNILFLKYNHFTILTHNYFTGQVDK
jgi:hypothetical protein